MQNVQIRASAAQRGKQFGARVAAAVFLLLGTGLTGCAKPPSSEECKAAVVHAMELQLDSAGFRTLMEQIAATSPNGQSLPPEQLSQGTQWLKSQAPSLVTPAFVAQCVQRMQRKDVECTLSATTSDELLDKCHWKAVPGPRGTVLGF